MSPTILLFPPSPHIIVGRPYPSNFRLGAGGHSHRILGRQIIGRPLSLINSGVGWGAMGAIPARYIPTPGPGDTASEVWGTADDTDTPQMPTIRLDNPGTMMAVDRIAAHSCWSRVHDPCNWWRNKYPSSGFSCPARL